MGSKTTKLIEARTDGNVFEIGQRVRVIDQKTPVTGVVEKVSDWEAVVGYGQTGRCYYVRCEEWRTPQWIDEGFVEAVND